VLEQATRGLLNLGFGASEVKRALLSLASHPDAAAMPLPDLLREAIAALT